LAVMRYPDETDAMHYWPLWLFLRDLLKRFLGFLSLRDVLMKFVSFCCVLFCWDFLVRFVTHYTKSCDSRRFTPGFGLMEWCM
jgi:hypothetical protein